MRQMADSRLGSSGMARVVLVHGINNTFGGGPPDGRCQRLPALLGGIELAGGKGELLPEDVKCVFYGDVFRPPGRFLGNDVPPLSASDVNGGPELELLLSWWAAASAVDAGVVAPGTRTLSTKSSARAALLALSGSQFLARVSERMLVWWLKQVTAYFTDPIVRERAKANFVSTLGQDTRVVVAHSLGSVVAYVGTVYKPGLASNGFHHGGFSARRTACCAPSPTSGTRPPRRCSPRGVARRGPVGGTSPMLGIS